MQKLKYRSTLYSNYFTNQAGRSFTENYAEKFKEEKKQFAKEIIPLLPSDKSVNILDIGCGIGSLLAAVKEQNYTQVKGIDISSEQVKIANSLGVKEVECTDIMDFFSKNNQSFDVICGMDIIEHFTKDELVDLLILLKSKLNKNGRVIFRTPNADAPFASLYAQGDFTHENFMNSNSAKQVMMATGFQQIKILPSSISTNGFLKEILRRILWQLICFRIKLILFASGRSSRDVIFTPNMILTGILS
jgi:2-polyprenyl-3-methyl-5-hydroxy-6-metoxy-1,4-benzoquinol methylase